MGLFPVLQEKLGGKFPKNFDKARQWAKEKDCKMQFQAHLVRREHQPLIDEQPLRPPLVIPNISKDQHLALLQKVNS